MIHIILRQAQVLLSIWVFRLSLVILLFSVTTFFVDSQVRVSFNQGKGYFKSVPEWVTLEICDAINSRVTTGVHALLKSVYTCLFGQVFLEIFRNFRGFCEIFQVLWLFMGAMINHPPFCAVLNRHWHLTAYLQGLLPIKKRKFFKIHTFFAVLGQIQTWKTDFSYLTLSVTPSL